MTSERESGLYISAEIVVCFAGCEQTTDEYQTYESLLEDDRWEKRLVNIPLLWFKC